MAKGFFSREGTQEQLQEDFRGVSSTLRDTGGTATRASLKGQLAFDPSKAVDEFGSGFLDEAREGLGEDFESLVGQSVGAGRLRTGFFQKDAGRLFQDFNRRVSNAIAQQSLEASRQRLGNLQGLGAFGSDLLAQQTDLIGGAFDRATAEENAQGGSLFGKIAGGALGLVGGSVGGPIGAAIGNKVGGFLGNAASGGGGGSDFGSGRESLTDRRIFEGARVN
jgi:hypothetical protein